MSEKFFDVISHIDSVLASKEPKEGIKSLQEVLQDESFNKYFFENLKDPKWLEPLREKKFFSNLPEPQSEPDKGTVRFPPWSQSTYLSSIAGTEPELVTKVILELPETENPVICADLIDAMLAMPPQYSVPLLSKTKKWAQMQYVRFLSEKLSRLVVHLAGGAAIDSALELAETLLEILPEPRPGVEQKTDLSSRDPKSRLDEWDYRRILGEDIPDLVRIAGNQVLQLLCSLLRKAVEISYPNREENETDDYSYIWRPAVEDHEQNLSHGIKDALVSAVRDNAERLVQEKMTSVKEVVQLLESKHWKIFRRIALHTLRLFSNAAPDLVLDRLIDYRLFDDHALRHEYALLLGKCFKTLPPDKSKAIIAWIEKGPALEELRSAAERRTGKRPTDEHADKYRKNWQRDRLAWIQSDLPGHWSAYYKLLVDELGEPEDPDITSPSGSWVGPTSPLEQDELQDKSVEEIVSFLKDWTPTEGWREPSPEGLGHMLSATVANRPDDFAQKSAHFQGLNPTYVRSMLSGLQDALRQNRVFPWEPVLELSHWLMDKARETAEGKVQPFYYNADWGPARKSVADLVFHGLLEQEEAIPYEYRDKVWAILEPLTDDPEPTPEFEEEYGGSNMDPATLSINTVRGAAMHAVIRYGLWVQRSLKKPNKAEKVGSNFEQIPEVKAVLERHLDPEIDPSLAVRAVYGQWFPWILNMDDDWTTDRVDLIFPREESHQVYRKAAWEAYITFCRPYMNVFEVLKAQYGLAIDRTGVTPEKKTQLARPEECLVEHLMAFYWLGKISLNDPEDLVVRFFEKAPAVLCGHAISFIGRAFQNTEEEIPEETIRRAKDLWDSRLVTAKSTPGSRTDFQTEIAAFGWWFISKKFDEGWALLNLLESLKFAGRVERDHSVVERLAELAEQFPRLVVQCLEVMLKGDHETWHLSSWRGTIKQILKVVLASDDADVSSLAEELVHHLGSRGNFEFRDLLISNR